MKNSKIALIHRLSTIKITLTIMLFGYLLEATRSWHLEPDLITEWQ